MHAVLGQIALWAQKVALRSGYLAPTFLWVKDHFHGHRTRRIASFLHAYSFKRGDVVIDAGANIGNVTNALIHRGVTVYAFEPDSVAYNILNRRFGSHSRVFLSQSAVWIRDGYSTLYTHPERRSDPARWTVGSSLFPQKRNVSSDSHSLVPTFDIASFILSLQCTVKLLKMDIEGAEYIIIHHLISTGVIEYVDKLVVELHPPFDEASVNAKEAIAELLRQSPSLADKIDWGWM
jgi:FkbM family methyltransferase